MWLARFEKCCWNPTGDQASCKGLCMGAQKKEVTFIRVTIERSWTHSLVLLDFEMSKAQINLCYLEWETTFYILIYPVICPRNKYIFTGTEYISCTKGCCGLWKLDHASLYHGYRSKDRGPNPREQACFRSPLLNQPEGFSSLSSLNLVAAFHFLPTW